MAVARLVGLAVHELHHARHGIVALEVGVIETLDYLGQLFQLQGLFQLAQDAFLMSFGVDEGALLFKVDLILRGIAV